jgi:hypothetical protein
MKDRSISAHGCASGLFVKRLCIALALIGQALPAAPATHAAADAAGHNRAVEARPAVFGGAAPHRSARRSHIMVRIKPRLPSGPSAGDGSATITLYDGSGNPIAAFDGVVGRAVGVRGPRRDITSGDTPFGVYRHTMTSGGAAASRLGKGYGTGKVYVDDHRSQMYGDVADARRSLIRLHGGGSGLSNPYAPNQRLLPTLGCVRMRNADVNSLIRHIERLSAGGEPLQFIYMGSEAYLFRLARNPSLSGEGWWEPLRIALRLPPPSPSEFRPDSGRRPAAAEQEPVPADCAAPGADVALAESLKVFSEDVGETGQAELARLEARAAELRRLQQCLPPDSPTQPRIAFALCHLGGDCDASRRLLESALEESSPYADLPPDLAAEMLSRLVTLNVSRSDEARAEEAMVSLFNAAPAADGALSEGLGAVFTEKLRTQNSVFFSAFGQLFSPEREARGSADLRTAVYDLLRDVGRVTEAELRSVPQRAGGLRESAPQLGQTVRRFTAEYRQRIRERRQGRR